MSPTRDDELISGYLDGELNSDEQARIKQLLHASAESRQRMREFRALRDLIKSLPRHTLTKEFNNSVLQRIERSGSAASRANNDPLDAAGQRPFHVSDVGLSNHPLVPPGIRTATAPHGKARGVIWATLALAATLLLALLFGPFGQPRGRQAADARHVPHVAAEPGAKETRERSTTGQRRAKFANSVPAVQAAKKLEKNFADNLAAEVSGRLGDSEQYVVIVDLPEAALLHRVVDETLASNGIEIVEGEDPTDADQDEIGRWQSEIAERFARQADKREIIGNRLLEADVRSNQIMAETAGVEVLVVNATPSQIDATIAKLSVRGYRLAVQEKEEEFVKSLLQKPNEPVEKEGLAAAVTSTRRRGSNFLPPPVAPTAESQTLGDAKGRLGISGRHADPAAGTVQEAGRAALGLDLRQAERKRDSGHKGVQPSDKDVNTATTQRAGSIAFRMNRPESLFSKLQRLPSSSPAEEDGAKHDSQRQGTGLPGHSDGPTVKGPIHAGAFGGGTTDARTNEAGDEPTVCVIFVLRAAAKDASRMTPPRADSD